MAAHISEYKIELDATSLGFGLGLLKLSGTIELDRSTYHSLILRVVIAKKSDGAIIFSRGVELKRSGHTSDLGFSTEFTVPVKATSDVVRVDLWVESVVREKSTVRSATVGRRPPPARTGFDNLQAGQLFDNDRYRIERRVCASEHAAIYVVAHTVIERKYAIKAVPEGAFEALSQSVATLPTRGVVRVSDIGSYPGIAFAVFGIDVEHLDQRFLEGEHFDSTLVAPLASALQIQHHIAADIVEAVHGVQPPTSGTIGRK